MPVLDESSKVDSNKVTGCTPSLQAVSNSDEVHLMETVMQ